MKNILSRVGTPAENSNSENIMLSSFFIGLHSQADGGKNWMLPVEGLKQFKKCSECSLKYTFTLSLGQQFECITMTWAFHYTQQPACCRLQISVTEF